MFKHEQAIGKRIRELRTARKITQTVLSELADLSVNYMGQIERGEVQASVRSLVSIAHALKVNPSELFVYLDKPQSKAQIVLKAKELLDLLLKQK